jgi:hypothetical protein
MKNITFTIICFLYCLATFAQESTPNLATFSAPNGSKRVTKEQFLTQEDQQFKRKLFSSDGDDLFFKNAYTIDGVLISVYDWQGLDDKRTMQQLQREQVSINPHRVKHSQITTINNTQFLILDLQDEGSMATYFYSDAKGGKRVQGVLQFNNQDEEKAKKVLDNLLKSIRFKVN